MMNIDISLIFNQATLSTDLSMEMINFYDEFYYEECNTTEDCFDFEKLVDNAVTWRYKILNSLKNHQTRLNFHDVIQREIIWKNFLNRDFFGQSKKMSIECQLIAQCDSDQRKKILNTMSNGTTMDHQRLLQMKSTVEMLSC